MKTSTTKKSLSLLLCLILLCASLGINFAEGPNDPAPTILPSGNANGKKILFDNTHGQTAGAADWVIDGGFSDFAQALANRGYSVKELRKSSSIQLSDLQDYDVFIMPEANIPYKVEEQQAILDYVSGGGSVFFIADHYNADRNKNRWDSSEVFNGYRRGAFNAPTKGMSSAEANSAAMNNVTSTDWLGSNFGIRFRYNAIGNVNATMIVEPSQAFGITNGVNAVAMHAGSTLAILDPNKAKGIVYLPQTNAKWNYAVDSGVYNGGGIAEGPFVAVSKRLAGKAAFIGDSSPVEDASPKYLREENGGTKKTYDGFSEVDDARLLVQLVDWLATKESYTSFDQVNGLTLDTQTALHNFEIPENSTEPQAEPWSSPDANYLWYDQSTFVKGSYGAPSDNDNPNPDPGTPGDGTPVFFSEYIEGSSYNKALEIYNGTSNTIDLSKYVIKQSNTSNKITLSGMLNAGKTFVIAHTNASNNIKSKANALTSQIAFNGDDAIYLFSDNTLIDTIGTKGVNFAKDTTLRRHESINKGNTTYTASEWTKHGVNDASDLGQHNTTTHTNHPPTVTNPIGNQSAVIGTDLTVSIQNVFTDEDGDILTFSVQSNDQNIITAILDGMRVILSPQSKGNTTITVTATDNKGAQVTTTFDVAVSAPVVGSRQLFFSEYIEGSSYNKALEIYNGTPHTIDLSEYTIKQSNSNTPIYLSGTVQSGQTFVIAHDRANAEIKNKANALTGNIVYNGNDSITLLHNNTIIDVIGIKNVYFGKDITLRRNASVSEGKVEYTESEWTSYPKNTASGLGAR